MEQDVTLSFPGSPKLNSTIMLWPALLLFKWEGNQFVMMSLNALVSQEGWLGVGGKGDSICNDHASDTRGTSTPNRQRSAELPSALPSGSGQNLNTSLLFFGSHSPTASFRAHLDQCGHLSNRTLSPHVRSLL